MAAYAEMCATWHNMCYSMNVLDETLRGVELRLRNVESFLAAMAEQSEGFVLASSVPIDTLPNEQLLHSVSSVPIDTIRNEQLLETLAELAQEAIEETRVGEVVELLDAPLSSGKLGQAYAEMHNSFSPPLLVAEKEALRLMRDLLVLKTFVGVGGALSSEPDALRTVSMDDALCQVFECLLTDEEFSQLHLSLFSMHRLSIHWEGPRGFNL